jgi:hypothetical protein
MGFSFFFRYSLSPNKLLLAASVASEKEITATALAFIIAGHDRHHRMILEERYLPARAHA